MIRPKLKIFLIILKYSVSSIIVEYMLLLELPIRGTGNQQKCIEICIKDGHRLLSFASVKRG